MELWGSSSPDCPDGSAGALISSIVRYIIRTAVRLKPSAMDPERWREIERLYHLALEQEPAEQDRFLADACQDDAELRAEVESLLTQSGSTWRLVDQAAWAEA